MVVRVVHQEARLQPHVVEGKHGQQCRERREILSGLQIRRAPKEYIDSRRKQRRLTSRVEPEKKRQAKNLMPK